MTTMGDVVTSALRRLRVVSPRRMPDGAVFSSGLTALNEMMSSWKGNGVDVDHSALEATDDFPLDDEHVQGVTALLAVRLSSDYGKELDAGVVRDAENGWSALLAEFVESAPDARVDDALLYTSLGRWYG